MMGKVKKDKISKPIPDSKTKSHPPKKKKNADKKGPDDWNRKFGYIFPQSIKHTAESIGIANLSDEVAKSLAEDVSYRLRGVVQLCAKYLKHSRHKRLTCQDVNQVLTMCDIPPVYGHSAPGAPHTFSAVREAGVLVLDDPVIDLANYALTEVAVTMRTPLKVTGKWLTADDNRSKLRGDGTKTDSGDLSTTNHTSNSPLKSDVDGKSSENHKVADHLDSEPKIATNLIKYYGITCNTILGHSDLKLVFRDLSRNEKIVPIIPYLLNFITITLNKLTSERQLLRLLQTVTSLTDNTRVDITPYYPVRRVANALLKIIKSPAVEKKELVSNNVVGAGRQKSQASYSYALRCRAAQVLGKVMTCWLTSEEQRTGLVLEMGKLLQDLQVPPIVHVGALTLLNELGPEALQKGLWPHLTHYLVFIRKLRQDRRQLQEILLNSANILYKNPHMDGEVEGIPAAHVLDRYLFEFFGDAICCARLHLLDNPRFLQVLAPPNSPQQLKSVDTILKRPWRLPKCVNPRYNPEAKRLTVHNAFKLPKTTRKRNPRIIFKFVGAKPVPEMSLRRRRLDSRYSQFIAGKESEGHVVLVGKFWRCAKQKTCYPSVASASLFTML